LINTFIFTARCHASAINIRHGPVTVCDDFRLLSVPVKTAKTYHANTIPHDTSEILVFYCKMCCWNSMQWPQQGYQIHMG